MVSCLQVVFSPLFVMRSHLPDVVFVQVEKRSLGQKECQLIQGQGREQALFNLEPNLTHHLIFQARYVTHNTSFTEVTQTPYLFNFTSFIPV